MNVRRSAAALAAISRARHAAAPADGRRRRPRPPQATVPAGLYGNGDPTYDGVWRQSLALLAQDTVGRAARRQAVDWLAGQQCADGGFAAFRADTGKACDAQDAQVDTNSTAAAVQALAALGGHDDAIGKAVDLAEVRAEQGRRLGLHPRRRRATPTPPSVVVGALAAAGEQAGRASRKGGKSPYDALADAGRCPATTRAAARSPSSRTRRASCAANADATAAGVLGALGKGLVVEPGKAGDEARRLRRAPARPHPGRRPAANGAAYLTERRRQGRPPDVRPRPAPRTSPTTATPPTRSSRSPPPGADAAAKKPLAWLEKNAATGRSRAAPPPTPS